MTVAKFESWGGGFGLRKCRKSFSFGLKNGLIQLSNELNSVQVPVVVKHGTNDTCKRFILYS